MSRRLVAATILLLVAAVCSANVENVAQRAYEKTRYDRSTDPKVHGEFNKKQRFYTDAAMQFTAYKDAAESICYLEKVNRNDLDNFSFWRDMVQGNKKTLYASDRALTKIEAWHLAGGRIVDFCKGMTFILIQEERPTPDHAVDPFFNELPEDEIKLYKKRITNGLRRPLGVRVFRPKIKAEREKSDEMTEVREKREAHPSRGRFRGQTQSQYLNVGSGAQKEGKAEAEATQNSSRAVVSGSSGMGQAQSMSSGNEGCESCPGYDRVSGVPGSIIAPGVKN